MKSPDEIADVCENMSSAIQEAVVEFLGESDFCQMEDTSDAKTMTSLLHTASILISVMARGDNSVAMRFCAKANEVLVEGVMRVMDEQKAQQLNRMMGEVLEEMVLRSSKPEAEA